MIGDEDTTYRLPNPKASGEGLGSALGPRKRSGLKASGLG